MNISWNTSIDRSSSESWRRRWVAGIGLAMLAVGLTACPPPTPAPGTATIDLPGGTVTVAVPAGATVTVGSGNLAALPALPTSDFDFDLGALDITVRGVTPGAVVIATVTVPVPVTGVRKLIDGAWDPFTFNGTTGATIAPNGLSISVALQDGGRGDLDQLPNGTIVDPLAPVTKVRGGGTTTTTSTTSTVPTPPAAGCYQNSNGNVVDLYYTGNPEELGDLQERGSVDGSCTGPQGDYRTLVFATDYVSAGLVCQSLGLNTTIGNPLQAEGWTGFPSNAWYCPVSSPPVTTTTTTVPTLTNPAPGCYDNARDGQADVFYTGTTNVLGNAIFHASGDGSCAGVVFPGDQAIVLSFTENGAISICQGLGRTSAFSATNDYQFNLPPFTWVCTSN